MSYCRWGVLKSITLCIAASFIVLFYANADAAYQTNLQFSGYLQDSLGDIDVGNYSVPVVHDWNSDGVNDLLIGQRNGTNGFVSYYENLGTNSSPVYGTSSYIQACAPCSPLDVAAGG